MARIMTEGESDRFAVSLYGWLEGEGMGHIRALRDGLDLVYLGAPEGTEVAIEIGHPVARGLLLMAAHAPPRGGQFGPVDSPEFRQFQQGFMDAVQGVAADLRRKRSAPAVAPVTPQGKERHLTAALDAAMASLYAAVGRAVSDARQGGDA